MNILFVGTAVPQEIEYRTKDISAAGNRFQNNMIANLKALGHSVFQLSYLSVSISEEMRRELLTRETTPRSTEYTIRNGRGSLSTFRAIMDFFHKMKLHLSGSVQNHPEAVFCYNPFYAAFRLPKLCKKYGCTSILVLADYTPIEGYSSLKGKLYASMQQRMIREFDTVVGLSGHVEKVLRPHQRFILMEGGIDQELFHKFQYSTINHTRPVFMYSGLLSKVTGVDLLLDAFETITDRDTQAELWISGKGDLEGIVASYAQKNPDTIKYLGHMSYDAYVEKLCQADVLVNPRNMTLPENQNNFPSKVMDYLAAGKPIISSPFAGYERFTKQIYFYDVDTDNAGLKNMLRNVCSNAQTWQQTEESFLARRRFAEQFLWTTQLMRIIDPQIQK